MTVKELRQALKGVDEKSSVFVSPDLDVSQGFDLIEVVVQKTALEVTLIHDV